MSCELCKALLPPANEVCEGYVFTGVCLSTGGVCVVAPGGHAWLLWGGVYGCSGGHVWLLPGGVHGCSGGHAWLLPGGHAWLLPGGACMVAPGGHAWLLWGVCGCSGGHVWLLLGGHAWLLWGGHVWDTTRYEDTVNEWAVRILLECILVVCYVRFRKDIYIKLTIQVVFVLPPGNF